MAESAADWSSVVAAAEESLQAGKPFKRHWATMKRDAGRSRVSADDRAALQSQLADAGLAAIPPVDVVIPNGKEWVRIVETDAMPRLLRLKFLKETDLEEAIAESLPNVVELAGVEKVKRQFTVHGGKKIDILGRRRLPRNRWQWVVIEVESGDGHGESPAQVIRYAEQLRKSKRDDGQPLVGPDDEIQVVVITQDADESAARILHAAAKDAGIESKWLVANIQLTSI